MTSRISSFTKQSSYGGPRVAPLVLAVPILPGKVEAWRRFCQEIRGRRNQQYEEARQGLGIAREAIWLLHTTRSEVAVVYMDVEEPAQLLARLVASEHPFDRWFKKQLRQICGLDLSLASLGPMMELVFDWNRPSQVDET